MVHRYVVKVAAWLEILTGAIVVVKPVIPCVLLFGAKPEGIGKPLAGMVGIALLALGVACLPRKAAEVEPSAVRGLFVYNAGATTLLSWAAAFTTFHGFLLWPVIILHAFIAVALLLHLFSPRRPER